ncbi:MAG: DUF4180 domain-containing protein [Ignavibacteriales bacterium]
MEYQVVETDSGKYVDCKGVIRNEQDAGDLVAACGEHEANRLMLCAGNLTEDFYRLSTGLAGAVLQKLVNYHVKAAAVLPPELASRGRFGEMVLESNRGNHFRVFAGRDEAERWLTGSP